MLRIINSLKSGFVLVLDPIDIAIGKLVTNESKYNDYKFAHPITIDETIRYFEKAVDTSQIHLVGYDYQVIPTLIAAAMIEDDEPYAIHIADTFSNYIQLKTGDFEFECISSLMRELFKEARTCGLIVGFLEGFFGCDLT